MKQKDINQLSENEIKTKLKEVHSELMGLRLKKIAGQVEKTHLLNQNRKFIARLETALKNKPVTT